MLDDLTNQLRSAPTRLAETAIKTFDLQAAMSARFGYGLTMTLDGQSYFFHLPDVDKDPEQSAMLNSGTLPYMELLLRLRRRTHPDSVIIDSCCGCGARAVFYARSFQAKRVYALGARPHMVSLARKNIVLNDLEETARAHWLNVSEEKIKGSFASLDRYCKDQKITRVDLLSLNTFSMKGVTGGGAEELLAAHGPAMIFWGHGADKAEREKLKEVMAAHGYTEPESWTAEVLFWVSRI